MIVIVTVGALEAITKAILAGVVGLLNFSAPIKSG